MWLARPLTVLGRLRMLAAAGIIVGLAVTAGDAGAVIAPELALDADAQAQLQRIEASLNAVRTVRSAFQQNASNGETAQGQLYLKRPGRLRVEYQPPVPILVVADGSFLVYYDRALEQVSYIPLSSTPAGILLEKQISLNDPELVVTDYQQVDGTIRVAVTRKTTAAEGSILLIFDEQTAALRQWAVTDAQGITTLVTLLDPTFNVDVDSSLFVFKDPRGGGGVGLPGRHSP
ncbi:MAG: outer membrane lipoprotein carrier protein LolA [Rhodospirillales bacterium]